MNRHHHLYFTLLFIGVSLIFGACANQVSLTGGPKDEVPPQIDEEASIANYQTQFEKQDINLYFDEFVDLRDAAKQIVISPPLEFPPKIGSRLKKVFISFNESEILKEDVTYVINFGKSIRDFTESNELLNYTYVFSTGDYIDSLSISGSVQDAKTGKPSEDALVLLYTDDRDSIVYQERPYYFARTDKEGNYKINNLRSDTFKIMVLQDENLNYLYDPGQEDIGFRDSVLIISDTLTSGVDIELFREVSEPRYKSFDVINQGRARIDFEGSIDSSAIRVIDSIDQLVVHNGEDPYLTLWYHPRGARSVRYEVTRQGELDTVTMRINTRNVDTLPKGLALQAFDFDSKIGLHPDEEVNLSFDRPIREVAIDKIIMVDTLDQDTLDINVDGSRLPALKAVISSDWPVERVIQMTLLPGAVTDFFGGSHDTIERVLRIAQPEDFGKYILTPTSSDTLDYVISLLKGDKPISQVVYSSDAAEDQQNIVFDRLVPGEYKLEIIVDIVPNGKWDPGEYLAKRQSEEVYNVPLPALRANWTEEKTLDMQQLSVIDQSARVGLSEEEN